MAPPPDAHPSDDLLLALHDGVLFPGDKPVVEGHLKTCARCRTRLLSLTSDAPAAGAAAAPAEPEPAAKVVKREGPSPVPRVALVLLAFGLLGGGAYFIQGELERRSAEPPALASAPEAPTPAPAPSTLEPPGAPGSTSTGASLAPDASSPGAAASNELSSTLPAEPVEVISPNRNFRWRVVGLEVERTTDGGTSWRKQMVELAKPMTAGTSPSASVCWLVGRGGAVYVAMGTVWKPASLTEAIDLVKVAAIDSMNATVTAADGRQFSTGDAGTSWNPVP